MIELEELAEIKKLPNGKISESFNADKDKLGVL